jgi:hypothetical protein
MGCKLNRNNFEDIPPNKFICPECGQIEPEISKMNVDNKNIEFYCQRCAENEYNSKDFHIKKVENNNIICNFYFFKPENGIIDNNKFWFKEHKKKNERLIDKNSSIIVFPTELNKAKETIKKKNEELRNIIKFNEIIMDSCEKYQENYFHLKSLCNISKCLEKENKRDSNDLKFLLASFKNEIEFSKSAIDILRDDKKVDIEREKESIFLYNKKLDDDYFKYLSLIKFNQLKEIDLSQNEIKDIDSIRYMNLPFLEFLNLSSNKIEDINPLGEINTKKLKYLFIQNNQIKNIQVFKDCSFPKLKILRLEKNNIEENSTLFKEIIKIYGKNNQIIVTQTKIDKIMKLYNIIYNENTENINLEVEEAKIKEANDILLDKKKEVIKTEKEIKTEEENKAEEANKIDEANKAEEANKREEEKEEEEDEADELILKHLFIIITQKSENMIRKLKLTRNNIINPSLLNRIQFNFLEELDLSFNNIKSLNCLKGMKSKKLKSLLLSYNKINDLSPLINIKDLFPNLELITLNSNIFSAKELRYKNDLTNYLNSKKIKLQIIEPKI